MTASSIRSSSSSSLSGRLCAWPFTATASTWTARLSDRGRPCNPFAAHACDGTLRELRWTGSFTSKPPAGGIEG